MNSSPFNYSINFPNGQDTPPSVISCVLNGTEYKGTVPGASPIQLQPPAPPITVVTTPPQVVSRELRLHLTSLDESTIFSNLWKDKSGFGNHSTISTEATLSTTTGLNTSLGGRASCPCNNTICGLKTYTIEAWVCPTAWQNTNGNGGMILTLVGQYYLEVKQGGKVSVYCYGLSSPGYHDSNSVIPIGQTSHIACTFDTKQFRIYINGKLDREIDSTGTPTDTRSHYLVLGSCENNTYRYTGKIWVARIYGKALSPTEIMQNFDAEKEQLSKRT